MQFVKDPAKWSALAVAALGVVGVAVPASPAVNAVVGSVSAAVLGLFVREHHKTVRSTRQQAAGVRIAQAQAAAAQAAGSNTRVALVAELGHRLDAVEAWIGRHAGGTVEPLENVSHE